MTPHMVTAPVLFTASWRDSLTFQWMLKLVLLHTFWVLVRDFMPDFTLLLLFLFYAIKLRANCFISQVVRTALSTFKITLSELGILKLRYERLHLTSL